MNINWEKESHEKLSPFKKLGIVLLLLVLLSYFLSFSLWNSLLVWKFLISSYVLIILGYVMLRNFL